MPFFSHLFFFYKLTVSLQRACENIKVTPSDRTGIHSWSFIASQPAQPLIVPGPQWLGIVLQACHAFMPLLTCHAVTRAKSKCCCFINKSQRVCSTQSLKPFTRFACVLTVQRGEHGSSWRQQQRVFQDTTIDSALCQSLRLQHIFGIIPVIRMNLNRNR